MIENGRAVSNLGSRGFLSTPGGWHSMHLPQANRRAEVSLLEEIHKF